MDKIRFYFSIAAARALYGFLMFAKFSLGSSLIGRIVLKLCPNFLAHCNGYVKTKINVTGTNGKTTTAGLISHIAKKNSNRIINNPTGANMLSGAVNAFAVALNPFKTYDFSIIEADEAYLEKIYEQLEADFLVVTNLFRDQLDRYGELETTKKLIQRGIDKKPNLTLVLNADDPLATSFSGKKKIFYGIENVYYTDEVSETKSLTEEIFNCPCGKPLKYEKKFFAQQGHYCCNCGYKRPDPDFKADAILYKNRSELIIDGIKYEVPLTGLFNAYNALAAIALCSAAGIENKNCLASFRVTFGRSEVKNLNGKKVLIQLIKNPIGANEVLKTADKNSNILIVINDNYADGRDVSWLWDTEFELLRGTEKEIVVSGLRAEDMALRLKYAEIKNVKIIKDIPKAVEYLGKTADNNITILPTYTALLKINKIKSLRSEKCC